jgi:rfaE bifunctional protein nucleotidyltransferase chain/domain
VGEITTLAALSQRREQWRQSGQKLVLTNGVFDLVHVGHLRSLQAARTLGDLLVVALNSDASTRALKGPERPIVPEDERAELLTGFACVDYVVIFQEQTAEAIVSALKPDVYVKGGDYQMNEASLPEAAIVQSYGGRVVLAPLVEGLSSTDLIARIRGENR